jgi:hypothetical protein
MSDLEQLNNPIAEAYWRALIAKEIMDADLSEAKEISSDYYAATLRTQMVCSAIAKGIK